MTASRAGCSGVKPCAPGYVCLPSPVSIPLHPQSHNHTQIRSWATGNAPGEERDGSSKDGGCLAVEGASIHLLASACEDRGAWESCRVDAEYSVYLRARAHMSSTDMCAKERLVAALSSDPAPQVRVSVNACMGGCTCEAICVIIRLCTRMSMFAGTCLMHTKMRAHACARCGMYI